MLAQTGVQKSESVNIIRLRVVLVYTASLGIFFVPFAWPLIVLTAVSFYLRTFGWEGGYHRYFSHRAFKTSRTFQFLLACLGASSGQRGPIWWAVHHRAHHKYSDQAGDPHSPVVQGRLYSYVGWLVNAKNADTDLDKARDLAKFPELVWINKYHYLFPYALLVALFALGHWTTLLGPGVTGLSAVFWGFFFSTLLSLQGAFFLNAFTHGVRPGFLSYRSYQMDGFTTNNWALSVLTLGASWHNNHHRFMNAARAGFFWWEFDITYWTLRLLALFGIVWDLREVPADVLAEAFDRTRGRGADPEEFPVQGSNSLS
jgi:stearoyl-CoA desaturase (delta-9 desaturase)